MLARDMQLGRGAHALSWTPPSRGHSARTVRVVRPKPQPKPKPRVERQRERFGEAGGERIAGLG